MREIESEKNQQQKIYLIFERELVLWESMSKTLIKQQKHMKWDVHNG